MSVVSRGGRRLVAVVASTLTLALVAAACTGDEVDDASGGLQSSSLGQAADTLDPASVAPLEPVAGGAGPAAPVVEGVVVDQTRGSSTSTQPTLRWTAAPGAGPFRFTIRDLGPDGGRELWSSGDEPQPQVAVPEGVLANGRAYRWTVSDGAGGALGPIVFRVDVQRAGVQTVGQLGDVAVATGSGEAVFDWESPVLQSVSGPVGFRLTHRPTNGAGIPGLPAGWRLSTGGGGSWRQLVSNGDGTITAESESGLLVVFEPTEDPGSFRAVWGERQSWPSGTFASLVRNEDGVSFTLQDTSGVVTTFSAPEGWSTAPVASVWQAGAPSPVRRYRDGRLVTIEDQVSGRTIELRYGGEDCPAAGAGLGAPVGLLCGAQLWDGSRVAFGYQGEGDRARLVRLVGFVGAASGTEVTDLAFDGVGRLAAVRSPLAARAVVAGVRTADDSVATQVVHDDRGRVVLVTGPAARPGESRSVRSVGYSLDDPGLTSSVAAPAAPGAPVVATAVVDPTTFQVRESRDAAGRTRIITWDSGTDRVVEEVDPGGLTTRFTADEQGVRTGRVGPASAASIDSGAAPRQEIQVDRTFRDAQDLEGEAMRGLAVTYWANGTRQGDPIRSEVGPTLAGQIPDDFRFSWPESPVPGADWSARLTGVLRLPAAGEWSVTTGGAPLWVDERPCRPTCTVVTPAARAARIRVDVTGPSGDVDLTWTGPGVDGTVPSRSLAPALGRQGAVRTADATAVGAPFDAVGRTEWADPVAGVVGASYSQSGIRRSTVVEPYRPTEGAYGRVTGQTDPNGATRELVYHPARDEVADPCAPDRRHVQGGLVRSSIDPAGTGVPAVESEVVYDAAGREVAVRATADDAWTCTTRDAAGRAVRTENSGATGDEERSVELDFTSATARSAQDPLVTTAVSTLASGGRSTEVEEIDLLGRVVRVVDLWGTVVEQAYDPQFPDRMVASTVTPVGAPPRVTTYAYDVTGDRLGARTGDVVLAAYAYDAAGRVRSITNGPNVTTYGYDANGRPVERTVDGPSGRWSEVQVVSPAGRTLSATLDGPGDQDGTYAYTYDVDGRLVAAQLDSPLPVTERAWRYTYDPDGNLTARVTTDGTGTTRTVTNTYDDADHLLATDDPVFADLADPARSGRVVTDDHGRVTEIGPLSISYDSDGNASEVRGSDGSSVRWAHRFGRAVVRTTTAAGAAPVVQRSGASGVFYDDTGRFLGQSVQGAGGTELLLGADGTQRWTYSTIGGNRWFATDALGAALGQVSLYEPYGRQVTPAPAATPVPGAGLSDPAYQMVDAQRVGALDVAAFGSRTYLPALGRFLQPDPVEGGSGNAYAYTDGDPVNSSDTTGNMPDWLRTTLGLATIVVGVALAAVAGPIAGRYVAARLATNATIAGARTIEYTASFVAGAAIGAAGGAAGSAISFGEVDGFVTLLTAIGGGTASIARSWWRTVQMEETGQELLNQQILRRALLKDRVAQLQYSQAKNLSSFKVDRVVRSPKGDMVIIGEPIPLDQKVTSFTVIPNQGARNRSPSFGDSGTVFKGF